MPPPQHTKLAAGKWMVTMTTTWSNKREKDLLLPHPPLGEMQVSRGHALRPENPQMMQLLSRKYGSHCSIWQEARLTGWANSSAAWRSISYAFESMFRLVIVLKLTAVPDSRL